MSPGLLIEALVVCIMCNRKPLWKVERFWAEQDMELLFKDAGLTSDQLNDDALGRVLEKLARLDMKELLSAVSLELLVEHGLSISSVHLDTTTVSVQGAYENDTFGQFKIEYAYGKDHRMDLKKFKIGAAVQEQGLPVFSELVAGKESDMVWNRQAVLEMNELFKGKGYQNIVFVSDCVLVNTESLRRLGKEHIQFISRLPETFNLANELKDLAFAKDEWHDLGQLSASNPKQAAQLPDLSYQGETGRQEVRFSRRAVLLPGEAEREDPGAAHQSSKSGTGKGSEGTGSERLCLRRRRTVRPG